MNMLEITKAVRELISDPKRHTRGAMALNANGTECDPESPNAVCFCPIGAVKRVNRGDTSPVTRFWADNFKDLMKPERITSDFISVTYFNDHSSHEYVIDHLDQMIARMEHAPDAGQIEDRDEDSSGLGETSSRRATSDMEAPSADVLARTGIAAGIVNSGGNQPTDEEAAAGISVKAAETEHA